MVTRKEIKEVSFLSSWKPGLYRFHGQSHPCWFRSVWGKGFNFKRMETLSEFGVVSHRPVKFFRRITMLSWKETTTKHIDLKNKYGSFELHARGLTNKKPSQSLEKEEAKECVDKIRYYGEMQDQIFNSIASFLQLSKNKEEWLFDAAFNGTDFEKAWEEIKR